MISEKAIHELIAEFQPKPVLVVSSVKKADNRKRLPPNWRKAMVLACREKGMTFGQIATVAGCSTSRANQLYHRALCDAARAQIDRPQYYREPRAAFRLRWGFIDYHRSVEILKECKGDMKEFERRIDEIRWGRAA